jgi:hypothetical protein
MTNLKNQKELEKKYLPFFIKNTHLNENEAHIAFQSILIQAQTESIAGGTDQMPINYGTYCLEKAKTDPQMAKALKGKTSENITEKDLKWWWNKSDIERRLIHKIDNVLRLQKYLLLIQSGCSEADAVQKVRANYPMYGNPSDETNAQNQDRPLPYELKNRINAYLSQNSHTSSFLQKLQNFSSFNAFIRHEICLGFI